MKPALLRWQSAFSSLPGCWTRLHCFSFCYWSWIRQLQKSWIWYPVFLAMKASVNTPQLWLASWTPLFFLDQSHWEAFKFNQTWTVWTMFITIYPYAQSVLAPYVPPSFWCLKRCSERRLERKHPAVSLHSVTCCFDQRNSEIPHCILLPVWVWVEGSSLVNVGAWITENTCLDEKLWEGGCAFSLLDSGSARY